MASDSGTQVVHELVYSKVVALFLVKFDMKVGYQLIWKRTEIKEEALLSGIEFKALPSGIQESDESTVLLAQHLNQNSYHGLSRYRQKVLGDYHEDEPIKREDVAMYSLGVLCEGSEKEDWEPNRYVKNGWEYLNILDETLVNFINNKKFDDFSLLESLYDKLISVKFDNINKIANPRNHPLLQTSLMFDSLGPILFPLFKLCLLRKRIALFHDGGSEIDNYSAGCFTYLLMLLSLIPNNCNVYSKAKKISTPLFTAGLHDMENHRYLEEGVIFATNDEILITNNKIYDYGATLPSAEEKVPYLFDNHSSRTLYSVVRQDSKNIKATLKDYHKFKHSYSLINKNRNSDGKSLTSIQSATLSDDGDEEPLWWLAKSTEPMSWSEYIWSAFSWFASAGSVTLSVDDNSDHSNAAYEESLASGNSDAKVKDNLLSSIELVSQFHDLTSRWFRIIEDVILEEFNARQTGLQSNANDLSQIAESISEQEKITIQITYQDMEEMELDPYSSQDLKFIREFVLLYWGSVVDEVEIGIGVFSICC